MPIATERYRAIETRVREALDRRIGLAEQVDAWRWASSVQGLQTDLPEMALAADLVALKDGPPLQYLAALVKLTARIAELAALYRRSQQLSGTPEPAPRWIVRFVSGRFADWHPRYARTLTALEYALNTPEVCLDLDEQRQLVAHYRQEITAAGVTVAFEESPLVWR